MRNYYYSQQRKAFFIEKFETQGGRCAICERPENLGPGLNRVILYVDHEHETGYMRGLLCHNCNTGIGQLRDNPELLRKAADYIEQSKPRKVLKKKGLSFQNDPAIVTLIKDTSFKSDRARARRLSEEVGIKISTALGRIHRARKKGCYTP